MDAQQFYTALAISVLGLFVGSNIGVALMCVLQVAGGSKRGPDDAEGITDGSGNQVGHQGATATQE